MSDEFSGWVALTSASGGYIRAFYSKGIGFQSHADLEAYVAVDNTSSGWVLEIYVWDYEENQAKSKVLLDYPTADEALRKGNELWGPLEAAIRLAGNAKLVKTR